MLVGVVVLMLVVVCGFTGSVGDVVLVLVVVMVGVVMLEREVGMLVVVRYSLALGCSGRQSQGQ